MILDCYKVLKMIEQRPALFIGTNSLRDLHTYICGYYQALCDFGIATASHSSCQFNQWVSIRLDFEESTAGWANMIVSKSLGLDSKNIDWNVMLKTSITNGHHDNSMILFYELLEEFKLEMEE